MGTLDDFAKDKSGPQLTMLLSIGLLAVSQFFLYLNDAGILTDASNYDYYTQLNIISFPRSAPAGSCIRWPS